MEKAIILTPTIPKRSEEHTSELQSLTNIVCRLLLEKKERGKACTFISYHLVQAGNKHPHVMLKRFQLVDCLLIGHCNASARPVAHACFMPSRVISAITSPLLIMRSELPFVTPSLMGLAPCISTKERSACSSSGDTSTTNPDDSLNNALSALRDENERSISAPILPSASPPMAISAIVVTMPPSEMSWQLASRRASMASITAYSLFLSLVNSIMGIFAPSSPSV